MTRRFMYTGIWTGAGSVDSLRDVGQTPDGGSEMNGVGELQIRINMTSDENGELEFRSGSSSVHWIAFVYEINVFRKRKRSRSGKESTP